MEISLERAGRFRATTMRPNDHKCASMKTRVYPWEVRIEGTDAHLTPEGFLINNEFIGEYFEERWGRKAKPWDAVSCEMLAIISAKEICAQLIKQGVSVQKVLCRIKGSNNAWVSAECVPGDVN